ncbi:MAG: phosphatase PAP2 family protein, partial [Arenimonas sp.]|nr:phosphatase PAP2 family protein [Arenimonas sp.]
FDSRGGLRWQLAARDAGLSFQDVAATFACALGFEASQESTPHLAMLMSRTLADAGLATQAAKKKFSRARPFMVLEQTSCTPEEERSLRTNGSYPSGHASRGWAVALVLAQLVPDRQDVLLARGMAFGQSRVHCGVHWQSDVNAGRVVGSATFAALGNSAAFLRQASLARAEIRELSESSGAPDAQKCAAERAALAEP